MHRTHAAALAALLSMAACAPAAAPVNGSGRPTSIIPSGNGMDIYIADDAGGYSLTLPATPEQTRQALIQAYTDLGLQVNLLDPATGRVGVNNARLQRRIGDQRLSSFLDCGTGMTGRLADMYRVDLSMVTTTAAADGGTRLDTKLAAEATSNEGASGAPVRCATSGRLERRLHEMVRAQLQP